MAENIFLVQELIRHYNRKRISHWVIIKIDLKRPWHSWLGFPRINVGSTCLHTPTYTLAINEGTHDFFTGKQRLRQGEPFSPYLFILSFECLSRLITINTVEDFNFHPKYEAIKLTHPAFVNDLMLFSRADEGSIKILMDSMKECETPQAYKLTSWSSISILAVLMNSRRRVFMMFHTFVEGIIHFGIWEFLLWSRAWSLYISPISMISWGIILMDGTLRLFPMRVGLSYSNRSFKELTPLVVYLPHHGHDARSHHSY